MERKMTPCEKLGYKVGDRFVSLDNNKDSDRDVGDFLIMKKDDGDGCPWFLNERTQETIPVMTESVKKISDKGIRKAGDTIEQEGKKYRVTLEEIPQYDFKPGMLCWVDWDGADSGCPMHSDFTRVIHLGNRSAGNEYVAYSCTNGYLAVGCVKTSNLRPE